MGQDSWNLQYGRQMPAVYRKGTSVEMHEDEGYGGPRMIPGYAGAYKNEKINIKEAKMAHKKKAHSKEKKSEMKHKKEGMKEPMGKGAYGSKLMPMKDKGKC